MEKRRVAEEAELKRKQEQAAREARLAAEEAERKRQQDLALLEKRRVEEEAERKRKSELALKEAQRVAEAAERARREEQALREARLAEEEAQRIYKEDLALQEKRRVAEEAERRRREAQAQREIQLAAEAAARKRDEDQALRDKQRAAEEADRQRKQTVVQIQKPTPEQVNRLFEEELGIWEKIKTSKTPEPLEAYLLRYPSGRFAELAQLLLDQELARQGENKIKIAASQGNPFTKGSATADTQYKVGDRYNYRSLDLRSGVEQGRFTNEVTQITDGTVTFGSGQVIDLLGNTLRQRDGRRSSANQNSPLEFAVGRRWVTRFKLFVPVSGLTGDTAMEFRIVGREKITVPAGTFDAFLVIGHGFTVGVRPDGRPVESSTKRWFAPEQSRLPIAIEDDRKAGSFIIAQERHELVSFKQL
ncbi:MAG: DUF3108 domain-containing protein [Betaproteobacteria bacterium]|nr:DUF3108 domain-containing protein [Betaproteobacteria bacterium]